MRKLDCENTQNLLDAFEDNALDAVTSLAVQDHLDTCVHCRRHWQWNKELSRSLGRLSAATPSADTSLVEDREKNVFEPWFVPRLRRRLAAAAIFVVLFVGGAALLLRQQSNAPAAMDFVRDHGATHEPGDENYLVTRDVSGAQAWLNKRVRTGFVIPKQAPDGFQLAAVRICHMGVRPIAQLMYDKDGKRLSLYLTEQSLASLRGLDHAQRHETSPIRTGECGGKRLAVWSRSDRSYVLVGDVSPYDLIALANRLSAEL